MTIDLLNREALMHLQDEALRTEREGQHALAVVQLQLCLNQYGEGLLSSHELLDKIADVATRAPRLRKGDMDIVTGTVFESASPESFLRRVSNRFDLHEVKPEAEVTSPFKPWMKDGDFLYLDDSGESKLWSETEALLRQHDVADGIIAAIQEKYCTQAVRVGGSAATGDVVLNAQYKEPDRLSEDFVFIEGRREEAGEGHWFDLYRKLQDARLNDELIGRIRRLIHDSKHVDVVKAFDPRKGLRLVTPDPDALAELQSFEFKGQVYDGGTFVLRNGCSVAMKQKPGFANFIGLVGPNELEFTSLGVALSEDRDLDVLYEAAPSMTPQEAEALVNDPQLRQASVLESIAGNVAEARGDALVVIEPEPEPETSAPDYVCISVEIMVRTENRSRQRQVKHLRIGEDYWTLTPLVEGGRYITRDLKLVVVESMFGSNATFRGSNGVLYAKNGMSMVPRGDSWVTSDGAMATDFIYQTQRVYYEER